MCALLNTPVCVFNSNKYHFPEAFPDWDSNRMCFTQLQLVCASSIMNTLNSHLKIHFTFIFGGGKKPGFFWLSLHTLSGKALTSSCLLSPADRAASVGALFSC